MPENVKINLTKLGIVLAILITLSSAIGTGAMAIDSARTAKALSVLNEDNMKTHEIAQARWEGTIDERTKNIEKKVDTLIRMTTSN